MILDGVYLLYNFLILFIYKIYREESTTLFIRSAGYGTPQSKVQPWTSRIDGQETPKNGKNYWGLMRFFWCCDKTVRDNFKIPFGYWGATISADSWTKEMLKSHKRSPHGLLAPKKLHFPKIGLFIPELKIIKSIWCRCLIICFLGQQVQ